jgi:hypothetical protein
MRAFWKFLLRRNLPTNSLESMQFAVLALGDSSYQKFNFSGKRLQRRLEQLGAQSLIQIGLADDQVFLFFLLNKRTFDESSERRFLTVFCFCPFSTSILANSMQINVYYKQTFLNNLQLQHDLGADAVIDPWLKSFWNVSIQFFPLPDGLEALPFDLLMPPKYKIEFSSGQTKGILNLVCLLEVKL